MNASQAAVLYSGGTDSTCVAALLAKDFTRVHLLTFEEIATRGTPIPEDNVRRLKAKFGSDRFVHTVLGVDWLARRIAYHRFSRYLAKHGLFLAATPGFSSLSWHARALLYCVENGIADVADGVTRELPHFPGHMPAVQAEFARMYSKFGIRYDSPLRTWDTPPDRRFTERMIVDRHAELHASAAPGGETLGRTSGRYLFDIGLFPSPNVKGTALDAAMQHACYPFVLFNMLVFWHWLAWHDLRWYEGRMASLFRDKVDDLLSDLHEYLRPGADSPLGRLKARDSHA